MLRRILLMCLSVVWLLPAALFAQEDGLNLPTGLYVLLNSGAVQRYGRGAAGVATVTDESVFVLDFGVSPDGNWIIYRTETALTFAGLYTDSSGDIERETAGLPPYRGIGDTIAWSPDGNAVAYISENGLRVYHRQPGDVAPADGQGAVISQNPEPDLQQVLWSPDGRYLAAGASQNVWWIYRRDGTSMTLVSAIPSSIGAAWLRGGQLVFAPESGGLYLMDMDNLNAQTELRPTSAMYRLPYVRPDGTIVAFRREPSAAEGAGILVQVALANNLINEEVIGTAEVSLSGVRWAPEGRLLVALRSGVMSLINPQTGDGFTLPIADVVAYGWEGLQTFTAAPAIPDDLYFLAQDAAGVAQVWRLTQNTAAFPLTQSESGVLAFAVHDERLVYAADGALWLGSALTQQEPVSRLELGDRQVAGLEFSPDGSQIAYRVVGSGVWLIGTDAQDDPRQLLEDGAQQSPPFYDVKQFAPNLNALLAVQRGSETSDFVLVDLNTFEVRPMGPYDDAFFLRDGRILAYGTGIGIGDPPPTYDVVVFDVNTPAQVQTVLTLPGSVAIRGIVESAPNLLRLAVAPSRLPHGPYPISMVEVPLSNAPLDFATLPTVDAGFMYYPFFNADGAFLAGYVNLRFIGADQVGPVVMRDLTTNTEVTLSDPALVWRVRWGG